ncbi:mitochondrial fission 1 protein A [Rosa sericea]
MKEMMNNIFDSVSSLFGSGEDHIPWCNRDIIHRCEREVGEVMNKGESTEEHKSESIMRLSWALVHSMQREDVQRGIDMLLQATNNSMAKSTNSPLDQREMLYLMAVGYYRSGEYSTSRRLLNQCLGIEPKWRRALSLKKTVEDRIMKDGFIGIGITAGAIIAAGGIVAACLGYQAAPLSQS